MAYGPSAEAFCSAPRQTLPLRLRRRGSRACPARHGARPAPRLAGPSRPTLGPSALAGRRLAAATAGLRKASEPFKRSCPIHNHNEPPITCRHPRRHIYIFPNSDEGSVPDLKITHVRGCYQFASAGSASEELLSR